MDEPFFDLNKLHKKHAEQRRMKMIIGGVSLVTVAAIGIALLGSKTPSQRLATVSYGTGPTASMPINSSDTTPASTPTSTSNLSQEEAQDKALATQDQAQQDVAAAQNPQSDLDNKVSSAPAAAPTSAPNAWTSGTGILTGTCYYTVSYVSSNGTETGLGPVSLSVMPNGQEVWLTDIPTSSNSSVTERKIYRTVANGSMIGPFYLLTTIYGNTTTNYYDNTPDSNLPTYNPKYR
jgi:hypothetical protein